MGTSLKPRDAVADEHVKPETVHAFAQERTQELFEEHVAELPNLLPLERHVLAQYCRCLAVAEHCETILAEEPSRKYPQPKLASGCEAGIFSWYHKSVQEEDEGESEEEARE